MTKDASDTLRVTPLPFMVPRSNICLFPRTPTSSYGTLDPTIARTCGSSREERHRLQERNIVWRTLDERGAGWATHARGSLAPEGSWLAIAGADGRHAGAGPYRPARLSRAELDRLGSAVAGERVGARPQIEVDAPILVALEDVQVGS